MDNKKIEFRLPPGLQVPDGIESGKTFESMATFQVQKGGRLCLKAIGEHSMPGYSDDEKGEQGPPRVGSDVASRYHAALEGGNS